MPLFNTYLMPGSLRHAQTQQTGQARCVFSRAPLAPGEAATVRARRVFPANPMAASLDDRSGISSSKEFSSFDFQEVSQN